jgi:hypothetical protein
MPLLDEVYGFVRGRQADLAPQEGPEVWRNAFVYLDDKPTVEIGSWWPPRSSRMGESSPPSFPEATL